MSTTESTTETRISTLGGPAVKVQRLPVVGRRLADERLAQAVQRGARYMSRVRARQRVQSEAR